MALGHAGLLLFVSFAGLSAAHRLQQAAKSDSEWVVVLNRGVKLNDIDCSSKQGPAALAKERAASQAGCRVCGGAPAVAAACLQNPKCAAFVMVDDKQPASEACGILKSTVTNTFSSQTQTLYCNPARGTTKCSGQFRFTPRTGMMFTGDYRCSSSSSSSSSSLCFSPGGINTVAAACLKDEQCKAFAYNRADQGGYFKTAAGVASPTTGSDLYKRA